MARNQEARCENQNKIKETTRYHEMKRDIIRLFASIARKHTWLRYPLFGLLTAVIFICNLGRALRGLSCFVRGLSGVARELKGELKRVREVLPRLLFENEKKFSPAKALTLVMTVAITFTSVDVTAFASTDENIQAESYEEVSVASDAGDQTTDANTDASTTPDSTIDGMVEEAGTETDLSEPETEEILTDEEGIDGTDSLEDADKEEIFSQSTVENGVEISVNAPKGVFPAGAKLHVRAITDSDASKIDQLVTEKKDEQTDANTTVVVEQSYSFDITIVDKTGAEVEPDTSRGEASVSFKNVGAVEAEQEAEKELSVYYVTDDYSQAEELTHEVDADADAAVITAEHFSIYTVVITTTGDEEENYILHYYQGSSIAESYFTIYSEKELIRYAELLNGIVAGTVKTSDSIATILVNSDDANPMEGITGDGQSTDMTVSNLNLSVKLMDDITVTETWTPITEIPEDVTFDGAGHTITFESLAAGVDFDGMSPSALVVTNNGTINNITLIANGHNYTVGDEEEEEETTYATVTVRVNGQKAEIGEAITGAEALAASADGVHYVTLERDDDLSVYRTELENLFLTDEETGEVENTDETFSVYYVYEDENETISAATLTYNDCDAELNYVSVTYDLEGANTYKEESDGTLSEDVMASVRVDVKEDGSYEAQQDYNAVVMAAEGYEIPTRERNVIVAVDESELTRGTDYTYTYDAETKQGKIYIAKEKITAPITVTVHADSITDNPPNRIILKTRGGSITDALWNSDSSESGTYTQDVYQDTALPETVSAYKNSDAISFAGWYTTAACIGTPVTSHTFTESEDGTTATTTYYAKWVLATTASNNGTIGYVYQYGGVDIRGTGEGEAKKVTYGYGGFSHQYVLGELSDSQKAGSDNGEYIYMVRSKGDDIFTKIGDSDIYVAMVCTNDSNSLVDITYIFENRGDSEYTDELHFGLCADVAIAGDDKATVEIEGPTENGVYYMNMTSRENCDAEYSTSIPKQQFRLYIKGANLGVDDLYSYWYGSYYNSYTKKLFYTGNDENFSDSALAFSWLVNNIPAGGYVTKTTKMGISDIGAMSNITADLHANDGTFSDGTTDMSVMSDSKSITVNTDGTITVKKTTGNVTIDPPTRSGYKFDHWSLGSASDVDCAGEAGKEYTESVSLFANWVPKPESSVTNNCSIQKVNGSDNLLVPSALGKIVIENLTTGATVDEIDQGETVTEAAGYACGFKGVLKIEGEDDRYLLPDNIEVTITDEDGNVTKLTKDTGYTYIVYDNRKKADLEILKQFVNGDVTITAVGYELPPVTATNVSVTVPNATISYGDRAVFKADAETSKNHVASYQWYIAPYYEITLDNVTSWTYQNQDGIALSNGTGTYTFSDGGDGKEVTITVTGANKSTLRISGLDVNEFTDHPTGATCMQKTGMNYAGYHVYCVVTSTRNITGQEIVAVSDTAEIEVIQAQYAAPTGLEGSATTYNGSADGEIVIEVQNSRPTLVYKKSTDADSAANWIQVTQAQLAAGVITGLSAGTYQFKYEADENHLESDVTEATVDAGRDIVVTYKSIGADDESLRTQVKHVQYGTDVTAETAGIDESDSEIQEPERTGYTFVGWSPETISDIQEDTTVNAVYERSVYEITLDTVLEAKSGDADGTSAIYEKYSEGFYTDRECTSVVNGVIGITVPVRSGYLFQGYFTSEEDGTQIINADGRLSGNLTTTRYLEDTTLYAHWEKDETEIVDPGEEENTYTITYKDATGSNTGADFSGQFMSAAQEVGVNGTAVTLPSAMKTGYSFGGWFLNAKGTGRAITAIPESQTADVTVYAKWIAYKYTLTLETNGGSYTDDYEPADQYQHGGANVVLPDETQISKENYAFLGWFDNAQLLGDAVTEVDASQVGAKTYYAGWEKLGTHEITLTDDGADGAIYTIASEEGYGFVEDGTIHVYDGGSYCFNVTPTSAYTIKAVKANGKVVTGEDGVYTLSDITEDVTVTVVAEQLVSTEDEDSAVASILLSDGTTGYFDSLQEAVDYAANYGNGSVIQLLQDLEDIEIDAVAGNAYTIDLNGMTVNGDSTLLIEDGAVVTLTDSVNDTPNADNQLSVENRGELNNGTKLLNGILITELSNIGTVTNYGTVTTMTQLESETEGEKSKFDNFGTIGTATLESGYFVEEVLDAAPEGLTGYHTIMNGNEYYVDFSDAVDIANASDSDVTIQIFATVDNLGKTIELNNENGKLITVDLNGYKISSGEIHTSGDVSFVNMVGSATNISEITAAVTNDGTLTIGDYVKISGTMVNEEDGQLTVDPDAIISGATTNKGDLENDGNMTGVLTNDGGNVVNNNTMNNVIQKDGEFVNNKDIKTKLDLQGGSYKATEESDGTVLDGASAKSNTNPVTYYGTLADAAKDASDESVTGAQGQESPFVITILKDISDEELGANPVVISPSSPVEINLNNHQIGSDDGSGTIQIGAGGSESGEGTGSKVKIANEPEDGSDPDASKGQINTPVTVTEDGSVDVAGDVTLDQIDNSGSLKLEEGSQVEQLTNSGNTENDGTIVTVTQEDGIFKNGEQGAVETLEQTGGETTNQGGAIDKLTQTGGTTNNTDRGTIGELTQTGGTTTNTDGGTIGKLTQEGGNVKNSEDSVIVDAKLDGGSYTGEAPEKTEGQEETEEKDPAAGKTAKIVTSGGETIYFVNLEDALEYASGMSESPVTVTLLTDVTDETIDVTPQKSPASEVILDLGGKDITGGSISLGEGTNVTVTDSSADEKGTIDTPVTNSGDLVIDSGITLSKNVTNTEEANLTNKGTITGDVENKGNVINEGSITGTVSQEDGTYTNKEGAYTASVVQTGGETVNENTSSEASTGIDSVDLQKGSFAGTAPTNGNPDGVATSSDGKIYADIESAIEDANDSKEDVTITLTKDITLEESEKLIINNENGKKINIDLNGKDITGGTIQIGDDSSSTTTGESGDVTFTDSSTSGSEGTTPKGTISSKVDIKEDGSLTVGEDVTVDGGVTVAGDLENAGGMISDVTQTGGNVINTDGGSIGTLEQSGGSLNNGDGGSIGEVSQSGGNLTNGDGGTIGELEQTGGETTNAQGGKITQLDQTGGSLKNESTDDDSIESAKVSGGEYEGKPASTMDYDGAKVAVTTKNADGSEKTVYYPTIEDALEAVEGTSGNATIKLLDDVEKTDIENIVIDKPGITIDLNGHDVNVPVTVTETAIGTTITDNSSAETENGKLNDTLTNEGGLTIGDGVTAADVVNEENGSLDTSGTIDKLTNRGETTNNGTIKDADQISGTLDNQNEIENVTLEGGSYQGEEPTSQEGTKDAVAKIGNKYYASLEEAFADANQSADDVKIEILKDTALSDTPGEGSVSIGNENGKNITIDLGGHTVDGNGHELIVKAPGTTTITNSGGDNGALQTDITVDTGAGLTIERDTEIDGSVDNKGNTVNNGTITDDVTNTGVFANTDDGIIAGEVDNAGDLNNAGNIDNNVINHDNGHVDNSGNLNGQLENKDNGTADNSGTINQVKQTGGEVTNKTGGSINEYRESSGNLNNEDGASISSLTQTGGTTDSDGTIKEATVSDLNNYTGKLPENGLPDANAAVTYTNEKGEMRTSYYPSLQDAIDAASKQTPSEVTPVTETTTITGDVTIPSGVTLEVPQGKKLVVDKDSTLKVDGALRNDGSVENDGTIENTGTIKSTGIIENDGKINNTGTLNNSGDVTNFGTIENDGKLDNDGSVENNGLLANTGELNNTGDTKNTGTLDNDGTLSNDGSLTNDGTIDNTGMLDNSGSVVNNGSLDNTGSLNNGGNVLNIGTLENGTTGKIENKGDLSTGETGTTTNKGSISNDGGSINGREDATGKTVNDGTINGGSINGPLDNTSSGKINGSEKISGEINNEGSIKVPSTADVSDAKIENGENASFEKEKPKPSDPGAKPSDSGSGSGSEASGNQNASAASNGVQTAENATSEIAVADITATGSVQSGLTSPYTTNAKLTSQTQKTDNAGAQSTATTPNEQEVISRIKKSLSDADGRISIEGIEGFGTSAGSKGAVGENGLTAEEQAKFISSILTEEEKKAVLDGASARIWAETTIFEDGAIKETEEIALEKAYTNIKDYALLSTSLFKQIGDGDKSLVSGSTSVQVSFELPEKYRNLEGSDISFKIVRVIEDANGQVSFEEVEYTLSDDIVTMVIDTDTTYLIVAEENYSQSESDAESGTLILSQDSETSIYWYLIPAAVLALIVIFMIVKRRKDKKEENA